jgi:hypothetical protein
MLPSGSETKRIFNVAFRLCCAVVRAEKADAGSRGESQGAPRQQRAAPAAPLPPHGAHQH